MQRDVKLPSPANATFGAVVLAAGSSSRLGQPKQLLTFRGEGLVGRAVRVAMEAGAEVVFVVTGALHAQIEVQLETLRDIAAGPRVPAPVHLLQNALWAEGMATSVALGAVAAERQGLASLLVLACDQVLVTPAHLWALRCAGGSACIAASAYASRRGVPALFPAHTFARLRQLTGDRGARDLLQGPGVVAVPFPEGEFDLDTPADLARLHTLEA